MSRAEESKAAPAQRVFPVDRVGTTCESSEGVRFVSDLRMSGFPERERLISGSFGEVWETSGKSGKSPGKSGNFRPEIVGIALQFRFFEPKMFSHRFSACGGRPKNNLKDS